MECGCMKRPARVAACSRGGVENGSVKLDIPASRGLMSVMADQALFAYVTLFIIRLFDSQLLDYI